MTQANGASQGASITDSVFASDRDRGADFAAPAGNGQAQPPAQQQTGAPQVPPAQDATQQQAQTQPAPQDGQPAPSRLVPLTELQSERQRRQEEQRLRQEAEGRAAAYERMLQTYRQQTVQPQPQSQQPAPPPDPLTDPEGHARWVDQRVNAAVIQVQQQQHAQMLNYSAAQAIARHGQDAVRNAEQFAIAHGVIGQFASYPDPYSTLMAWHQQQQVLQRIGSDPNAYEERLRQEGAQRALQGVRQGQPPAVGANGQPQQPRFPTTLADQTAANGQAPPQSGSAMINSLFDSNRARRAF